MRFIAIQTSLNLHVLIATLTQTILRGVQTRGGEIELIHLNTFHIQSCVVCYNGWGKYRIATTCIVNDDFEALKLRNGLC